MCKENFCVVNLIAFGGSLQPGGEGVGECGGESE